MRKIKTNTTEKNKKNYFYILTQCRVVDIQQVHMYQLVK